MAPKALLALGVLMAVFLAISSEVTARETAETAKEQETKGAVSKDQYGGGHGCHHGCCGWYHGYCRRCCTHDSEVPDTAVEDAVTDQYGPRCKHGCCRWYQGKCVRCCKATGVKTEAKPHN